MSRKRIAALFAYIALAWGGSFVAIKIGLNTVSHAPVFFAALRLLVAAVVALPAAAFLAGDDDRWIPRTRNDIAVVAFGAVFIMGGANAFLFAGEQGTTSSVSSVLFSLNPVIATALAAVIVPEDDLSLSQGVGVLLGILGVVVVAHPTPSQLTGGHVVSELLVFCSALCIALGSVASQRFPANVNAIASTAWSLGAGGVLLLLVALALGEPITLNSAGPNFYLALAYLGILATAVAYTAYFSLIADIGAARTTLVSYLVPIVTAVVSVLFLSEPVTPFLVGGFALIVCGFLLVNRRVIARLLA
ncbi:permease of the drug/metabolite transporter (DMT) superfamily [Halarchaeum acidiphilum MH1-52-1]|uniref:Permease of the drug/metabolite transporter (DMT) superfamily n=1 Tax=Halarchaeum acidiphilum MH1-52-1 TaxID=1261545 RepID=U2YW25_9EURY|nr:DMT family transporter [Halarchaeum acidiphilum]GAD52982.1 permease of the drug/metabolite transporter (DMT) superfamily [Halarchaeum acidiphilum MH1-52-1]